MKKAISTLLLILIISLPGFSQIILENDQATYTITGNYSFIITKKDKKTGKEVYKAETKIPDKKNDEVFNPGANNASFELVGDNIVIVYDVWQKSTKTKDCSIKLLNTKTGQFNAPKMVFSVTINSMYSSHEIPITTIYSPDKSKLAVFKDNVSPSYDIDAEVTIYDTKSFNVLKSKKLGQKYEGQKRIFDESKFTMDNAGNISLLFSLLNIETKITTKSYSANLPFESNDMKDLKDLGGNASSEDGNKSHGHFYKTVQDYIDDKPIAGVRMKNGSFSWTIVSGTKFTLIDDNGNVSKEKADKLPSDLFTYKSSDFATPFFVRLIDNKPYIVLSLGHLCFYSLYSEQNKLYTAEGYDGELDKFKQGNLEDYLKKYDLLDDYKKDKPKREMRDNVNDYFNKQVGWWLKYINLVNEKMGK